MRRARGGPVSALSMNTPTSPLLLAAVLLSASCAKSPRQAPPTPGRYTVSSVPFRDVCISPVAGSPAPKRSDLEHYERARGFLEEGRLGFALTALAQTSARTPRTDALRAVLLTLSSRAEEAEPLHVALLTAWPQDGCVAMAAALNRAALGKVDEAVELAARAWELDPTDVDAALMWATLHGTLAPDTAEADLARVWTAFPQDPGAGFLLGLTRVQASDYDGAMAPLKAAEGAGLPVDEVLIEAHWDAGRMGEYVRLAAKHGLPVVAADKVQAAEDPMAALGEALGREPGEDLVAILHSTMGDLRCVLSLDEAPVTVSSFVGLATGQLAWTDPRTGQPGVGPLYKDVRFHRVIPDFMVQVGDPLGDGTGGPGYEFRDELSPNLRFDRPGVLAMANSGPVTNGSQFFITEVPTPHLNGRHTIFGQCDAAAVERVKAIARVPTADGSAPTTPVLLESVEVRSEPRAQ